MTSGNIRPSVLDGCEGDAFQHITITKEASSFIDFERINALAPLAIRFNHPNLMRYVKVVPFPSSIPQQRSQSQHQQQNRNYEIDGTNDPISSPIVTQIVIERMDGFVKLSEFLQSLPTRRLNEAEAALILQQMVAGVEHLHSHQIVHGNLNLDNVFIRRQNDGQFHVKVGDFLVTNKKGPLFRSKASKDSYHFFAPEVWLADENKSIVRMRFESDVWSLGVIFYMLNCGDHPFKGTDELDIFVNMNKGQLNEPVQSVSEQCYFLIRTMLRIKPEDRPTLEQLKNPQLLLHHQQSPRPTQQTEQQPTSVLSSPQQEEEAPSREDENDSQTRGTDTTRGEKKRRNSIGHPVRFAGGNTANTNNAGTNSPTPMTLTGPSQTSAVAVSPTASVAPMASVAANPSPGIQESGSSSNMPSTPPTPTPSPLASPHRSFQHYHATSHSHTQVHTHHQHQQQQLPVVASPISGDSAMQTSPTFTDRPTEASRSSKEEEEQQRRSRRTRQWSKDIVVDKVIETFMAQKATGQFDINTSGLMPASRRNSMSALPTTSPEPEFLRRLSVDLLKLASTENQPTNSPGQEVNPSQGDLGRHQPRHRHTFPMMNPDTLQLAVQQQQSEQQENQAHQHPTAPQLAQKRRKSISFSSPEALYEPSSSSKPPPPHALLSTSAPSPSSASLSSSPASESLSTLIFPPHVQSLDAQLQEMQQRLREQQHHELIQQRYSVQQQRHYSNQSSPSFGSSAGMSPESAPFTPVLTPRSRVFSITPPLRTSFDAGASSVSRGAPSQMGFQTQQFHATSPPLAQVQQPFPQSATQSRSPSPLHHLGQSQMMSTSPGTVHQLPLYAMQQLQLQFPSSPPSMGQNFASVRGPIPPGAGATSAQYPNVTTPPKPMLSNTRQSQPSLLEQQQTNTMSLEQRQYSHVQLHSQQHQHQHQHAHPHPHQHVHQPPAHQRHRHPPQQYPLPHPHPHTHQHQHQPQNRNHSHHHPQMAAQMGRYPGAGASFGSASHVTMNNEPTSLNVSPPLVNPGLIATNPTLLGSSDAALMQNAMELTEEELKLFDMFGDDGVLDSTVDTPQAANPPDDPTTDAYLNYCFL